MRKFPPEFDLAYFLGQSLTTEQRREHELPLLQRYHAKLVSLGVSEADYPLEHLLCGMPLGIVYANRVLLLMSDGSIGARIIDGDVSDRGAEVSALARSARLLGCFPTLMPFAVC